MAEANEGTRNRSQLAEMGTRRLKSMNNPPNQPILGKELFYVLIVRRERRMFPCTITWQARDLRYETLSGVSASRGSWLPTTTEIIEFVIVEKKVKLKS